MTATRPDPAASAASEIREAIEEILAEADYASQCEQNPEAGEVLCDERLAAIIRRHCDAAMADHEALQLLAERRWTVRYAGDIPIFRGWVVSNRVRVLASKHPTPAAAIRAAAKEETT